MLNKILFSFRSIYIDTFLKRRYLCSIKYLNEENQELIYLCRGKSSLTTISFTKMIERFDLITNFMPLESALIGYYFGVHCYNQKNQMNYSINSFDFTKIDIHGEFVIKMIDRNKNIIFARNDEINTFTSTPLGLFSNKKALKKFHPLQSCYIGILAGIQHNKLIFGNNQDTNNIIPIN